MSVFASRQVNIPYLCKKKPWTLRYSGERPQGNALDWGKTPYIE